MATFSTSIAASADDARQDVSTVVLNGANITIDTATRYGGLRFLNVTIPQGSTINSATLTVTLPSASFDDPDVTIWGDDRVNSAAFSTGNNNISSRTATAATVTWTATGIGTGAKTSPSLTSIIQEIVNLGDWESGNDLALILKGNSTNAFRFNAFDGGGADYATINIDYTAPAAGGVPRQAMYYARLRS